MPRTGNEILSFQSGFFYFSPTWTNRFGGADCIRQGEGLHEKTTARPTTYIRSCALSGFADIVRSAGGDPLKLVREAGIDPALLNDLDKLVSWPSLCTLYELAAQELNRPNFGIEWSLSIPSHFPNVGPAVLLTNFCETAEEWMVSVMRYWPNHTNGVIYQFHDDKISEDVCFRFVTDTTSRQTMESFLAHTVRVTRFVANSEEKNPTLVRFRHAAPADLSLHRAHFRCEIEFGADHNEVLFRREFLKLPVNGGLRRLKWLIDFYARRRIRKIAVYDQSITATTRIVLHDMLSSGHCSIDFVAASLGLGTKKLQRLLAQEGTTFSDILEDVRRTLALELVADNKISIAGIAGLLDYAGTPPFTLAFKRWTGVSPSDYRQAKLGEQLHRE